MIDQEAERNYPKRMTEYHAQFLDLNDVLNLVPLDWREDNTLLSTRN